MQLARFAQNTWLILLIGCLTASLCTTASAEKVKLFLKGNSILEGDLLAEKRDQLVMDMGYTVLLVPRSQVARINKETKEPAEGSSSVPTEKPVDQTIEKAGLYSIAKDQLPDQSVPELTQKLGGAVVQVRTPSGIGSGFIIHPDGYLITNYHVIEGETEIIIEVYQEEKGALKRVAFEKTRIVALDKFADLALLKMETETSPTKPFPTVLLGDIRSVHVGQPAFAIGSPLGLERTVTEGIVSTKTRAFEGRLFLQTTTQINPGNSGGPLFSHRGEVIGVTNMKLNFSEGLGFAIPVDRLRYFLDNREAFAYDQHNPSSPYRYLPAPEIVNVSRSERSNKPEGGTQNNNK